MSLEKYCHDRLVVLSPGATAYQAARAMFANHIGAVLVESRGELIGIVTDRDLLHAVVAGDRTNDLPLHDVMTMEPVTIEIEATEEEAADVMRANKVRRLAVLDRDRLAGVVTLDDLLISSQVSRDQLRDIVFAQLTQAAPSKPRGYVRPQRPADASKRESRGRSRRAQTQRLFVERLMQISGLEDEDQALTAFEVFASAISRRLPRAEAEHFAAQLPAGIREYLVQLPPGPDRRVTRQTMEEQMAWRLDVDEERARELVWLMGRALAELVSQGELHNVIGHLPKPLQSLLREDEPRRSIYGE